jgi:hypothetical protein
MADDFRKFRREARELMWKSPCREEVNLCSLRKRNHFEHTLSSKNGRRGGVKVCYAGAGAVGRGSKAGIRGMVDLTRSSWTCLSDEQLLAQCQLDTYRASGPGGQKRNKTSSAVRLRHPPSGLIVIAEESRSQHENRARALRRLRQALYLKVREPLPNAGGPATAPAIQDCRTGAGRLTVGKKDQRLWPAVGLVLDVLENTGARVSETAALLGISTANLIEFLAMNPKVWEQVQHLRGRFGQKPLRTT